MLGRYCAVFIGCLNSSGCVQGNSMKFNEILYDDEKSGCMVRTRRVMEDFHEVLNYCGLEDKGFRWPKFTWCNKRDSAESIQERLDKGVGCFQWKQLFLLSTVGSEFAEFAFVVGKLYAIRCGDDS
ncbi:hypothetical protein Dsin_030162 [Dipteronia sinensis]|uniref:Uncharacterized protein n=1 Tax=Dipteronia sinensis TaxID=43782 RepID=A0AAD9ZIS2_9ROSI|nr:hypothetical protein Dsin_030162 [Dipteronia sinensis]